MELPEIEKLLNEKVKIKGGLFLGDADAATKLVDLKLGKEVSSKLIGLSSAIDDLKLNLHSVADKINKSNEIISDKIIDSNEKLSLSNEKYSKWSRNLTIALLVVTVFQLIVMFGQWYEGRKQNILSQDPIIEVSPDNGFINGNKFVFDIPVKNLGISDVKDIHIYEDFYIASGKNGILMKTGAAFLNPDVEINYLKINDKQNISIDLKKNDIYKQISDEFSKLGGGEMIGRLKLIYRRAEDNKKYTYKKIFVIAGGGNVLIFDPDQRENDMPSISTPSFKDINEILGQ